MRPPGDLDQTTLLYTATWQTERNISVVFDSGLFPSRNCCMGLQHQTGSPRQLSHSSAAGWIHGLRSAVSRVIIDSRSWCNSRRRRHTWWHRRRTCSRCRGRWYLGSSAAALDQPAWASDARLSYFNVCTTPSPDWNCQWGPWPGAAAHIAYTRTTRTRTMHFKWHRRNLSNKSECDSVIAV